MPVTPRTPVTPTGDLSGIGRIGSGRIRRAPLGGPGNPTTPIQGNPWATERVFRDGRKRTISEHGQNLTLPFGYGTQRFASRYAFRAVSVDQRYFYVVHILSEGRISAVRDILFGGASGKGPTELGMVLGTDYNVYLGTAAQAVDPIINAFRPTWVSGHPGSAYIAARFDANNAAHYAIDPLQCLVTADQLMVRDYSQDPTLVTKYFSTNPAWAIADFLCSTRYGYGHATTEIDWVTFADAAVDCGFVIASQGTAPSGAPTLGVSAGQLTNGQAYEWVYTWVIAGVETGPSLVSSQFTPNTQGMGRFVTVANGPAGTTSKRIYRNRDTNIGTKYLAGEIRDNTTTGFADYLSDSQLIPTRPPSGTIKRYDLGITFLERSSPDDIMQTLLAHCAGFLTWNTGKWQLYIDKARASSGLAFTTDNIIGDIEIDTSGAGGSLGGIDVDFVNRDLGFIDDVAKIEFQQVSNPATEAERIERRRSRMRLFGCPTADQATRLGRREMKRSRGKVFVSWRTGARGARPLPMTIVDLTHSTGPFAATPITITDCEPEADGMAWRLSGEVYSASDYDDSLVVTRPPILPPLPNPHADPPPVTNAAPVEVVETGADGKPTSRIRVTWTNPIYPFIRAVQITINDQLSTNTYEAPFTSGAAGSFTWTPPRLGVLHTITLRTLGIIPGVISSVVVTVTITPSFNRETGYVPMVDNVYDDLNGLVHWDPPINTRPVTKFATGWTNTNFPSFDGTKVNDNSLTSGAAFTFNTALTGDLDLDALVGKTFRAVRVSIQSATPTPWNSVPTAWYSDDGVAWTQVTNTGAGAGNGVTRDGLHFTRRWPTAGSHRYWRIERQSGDAVAANAVEVQFMEVDPLQQNAAIDHYQVWDVYYSPIRLIAEVPHADIPTATNPLDVVAALHPDSNNTINLQIVALDALGAASSVQFLQASAHSAAISPSIRVWAGSVTAQAGASAITGTLSAGGLATEVVAKTAAYTATDLDGVITASASGGAFTITLPTAVGRKGRRFTVKKTDSSANVVTVGTTSAQTIDGVTTFALSAQHDFVTVSSDNANWHIVSKTGAAGGGSGDIESVTAGIGLAGGGTSGAVTLDLSIDELTAEATPDYSADYLAIWDASASTHKKALFGKVALGTNLYGTYASRPSAGLDGRTFLSSDGPSISRDDGTIWKNWGMRSRQYVEPDDSGFTWTNQGTATTATELGTVLFTDLQTGSLRIRKKASPATPYTITACFRAYFHPGNTAGGPALGFGFRQASDGKLAFFLLQYVAATQLRLASTKYTNESTFSGFYAASDWNIVASGFSGGALDLWLRIRDDGTNRILSMSPDGLEPSFLAVHSVGRTDFLTGTEVFWAAFAGSTSMYFRGRLMSWEQTA